MNKVIALLVGLFCSQALIAAEANPQQQIRETANLVLNSIKTHGDAYRSDPGKLFALVDEVVLPHFDFDEMTDLALGKYRKKVSAEQKPLIVAEFRNLLVRTYGMALLEFNDRAITYLPFDGQLASGDVIVKTQIEQSSGPPIQLDYRIKQGDQGWKVYDISVDQISLVTNYRSSFARQIKKNGVDGLIAVLRERNQAQ